MGQLFQSMRTLVRDGRYLVSVHASERLEERAIMEWQVVDGLDGAQLLAERDDAVPNPCVEVRQLLPDGVEVLVVWAHLKSMNVVKLVTVHYFDGT